MVQTGPAPSRLIVPVLTFAALVAIGSGCGRAPGEDTQGTVGAGGMDHADRTGSPADLAAIDRLRTAYVEARNDQNVDRLKQLWTEDGVLLPIDEAPVIGREAIAAHIELQKGERSELAELAANIL